MPWAVNEGVRIYYEVIGRGKPLVMCHGLGDSTHGWREFGYVSAFESEWQLIMIDLRGHGQSDKPKSVDCYSSESMAKDVLAVLDVLRVHEFSFLGFSLGGWLGFSLATLASQRVKHFVVNGSHPFSQDLQAMRSVLDRGIQGWGSVIQQHTSLSPDQQNYLLSNDVSALRAVVENNRPDFSVALSYLICPSLFIAGEYDPQREKIAAAAAVTRNGKFVCLPGCNHFSSIVESQHSVKTIREFIQRN